MTFCIYPHRAAVVPRCRNALAPGGKVYKSARAGLKAPSHVLRAGYATGVLRGRVRGSAGKNTSRISVGRTAPNNTVAAA